jgi:hypothetical protein
MPTHARETVWNDLNSFPLGVHWHFVQDQQSITPHVTALRAKVEFVTAFTHRFTWTTTHHREVSSTETGTKVSKCRERDERPVWMNVQFGWKSGLDERSVRINVQTGQTSSQDENPVRVKVRFQEQIFLRHLHSSIRGRIFSLVEGLSIRGKLNPRVKNYFPFIQERKGRVVRLSKPKNAWIHIHMYDWVLLQSPEKIDIRRFICYRIRRYTMTSNSWRQSLLAQLTQPGRGIAVLHWSNSFGV